MVFKIANEHMDYAQAKEYLETVQKLNEEQAKQVLTTLGYIKTVNGASEPVKGFAASLATVTARLREQTIAWIKSPLGMATIAAVAIFVIAKGIDYWNKSLERSQEKLANLKEEYADTESELSSLNSELETTQTRLEELESKGALTFTEQEELENLKAQNRELQRSIELLELEQKYKQDEINNNFVETAGKHFGKLRTDGWKITDTGSGEPTVEREVISEEEYLDRQIKQYQENLETLKALDKQYANDLGNEQYLTARKRLLENNKEISGYLIDTNKEFTTYLESVSYSDNEAANAMIDRVKDTQDRIAIALGGDSAKSNAFLRLVDGEHAEFAAVTKWLQELGKAGKVTAEHLSDSAYDDFIAKLVELGVISGDTEEELAKVALAFNTLGDNAGTTASAFADTEAAAKQTLQEIEDILSAIASSGELGHYNVFEQVKDLREKLVHLSGDEISFVYDLVVNDGVTSWDEITAALARYNAEQELAKTKAGELRADITSLWDSEGFQDAKAELTGLSNTLDGITPEKVKELAEESDALASILKEDGMNAKFLANILQMMAQGGDGLSLITNESLALNAALDGMVRSFNQVTAAKERYDAAMSASEKDDNFKSYAEAFATLTEQFEAGTVNSNAFWASAEYLFGSDQLAAWGWSDGIDQIYRAMQNNKAVFEDADSAGAGFLDRLYQMSEAGALVNEQGEKLLEISRNADGSFDFGIDYNNIDAIAEKMGLTKEATIACLEALAMWGDIDFYNIDEVIEKIDDLGFSAETAGGKAINVYRLTEQLLTLGRTQREIDGVLDALRDMDGVVLLGVTENVEDLIASLEQLGLVSGEGIDFNGLLELMQAAGFAKEEVQGLVNKLAEIDPEGAAAALQHIDELTFANVEEGVGGVQDAVGNLNSQNTDTLESEIASLGTAAEATTLKINGIGAAADALNGKEVTMYYRVAPKSSLLGLFGFGAFAKGTKHAPAGKALVGEEGAELWQHGNEARLVGTDGPEIVDLHEGDSIYPAGLTKRMLRKSGKFLTGTIPAYRVGRLYDPNLLEMSVYESGGSSRPLNASSRGGAFGEDLKPGNSSAGGSPSGGSGSSSGGSGSSSNSESEFERLYKEHQHLLAMDKESVKDYLDWLNQAYQDAYEKGEIDLDDFYKYEEEVYDKRKDLFNDYLDDTEHKIDMLEHYDGTEKEIIALYRDMIAAIEKEIAAARASGLDDSNDYIQNLQQQWISYHESIQKIEEDTTDNAKDAAEELIKYRIDMLKQELKNQKEILNEKLSALKDFYDKQKELLQDAYDEEKYLEEQSEKRKAKSDIETELAALRYDDSAWAQKRKLELQEELLKAQKALDDFEKDHALDEAQEMLDDQYSKQETLIQSEIDTLDARLNDPKALYNQALSDIRNNTMELYHEMIAFNDKYGDGNPDTINEMWEEAYIFLNDFKNLFGEWYKGIQLVNATGYVPSGDTYGGSPIAGGSSVSAPSTNTSSPQQKTAQSTAEPEQEPEQSAPPLTHGSAITVKPSATHFSASSGNAKMAPFVPGGSYTVYGTNGSEVLIGRNGAYTGWINKSDIVGYASGTRNAAAGLHQFNERGSEYIFSSADGNKYRIFSDGEKVLNAQASNFLYDFANSQGSILTDWTDKIIGTFKGIADRILKPDRIGDIRTGDIIIQGSADTQTVSEIRRAQRENVTYLLKELGKLSK